MYFENFPLIEFATKKDGDPKIVTNLLRRVSLRSAIKQNILMFDTYDVKEGESPEMIAHKLYGDVELHWVVCMANDIVNRYHDWPLNRNQFLAYIKDKYDNPNDTHHYEISQTSGDTTLKIDVGISNEDYPTATAVTNMEYEEADQDKKRQIRLLDPSFIPRVVEEFQELMKESEI